MSTSGALVIIACNEANPVIDPGRHFNLNNGTTQVIRTAGGRTQGVVNNIHHISQSSEIGMVVVVQHTGCAWSPGDVECNIRTDIQALKASAYIPRDVPIIGYVLDLTTGQLREVKLLRGIKVRGCPDLIYQKTSDMLIRNGTDVQDSVPRTGPDAAARQHLLNQMNDFGPFWS